MSEGYAYSFIYDWDGSSTLSNGSEVVGFLEDASGDEVFVRFEFVQVSNPLTSGAYLGNLSGTPGVIIGSQVYSPVALDETVSYTVDTADYAFCLLAGTTVLTPAGECPIERVRIGDEVITHDGEVVPVRWIGRQSLITMFSGNAIPITIQAGALSAGVPSQDLHLSPDHAVLIDGYLVQAQALVNGTTVTVMDEPPAQLNYYHLELDQQRIIIADGAPVESFVDNVSRAGFDNYDEWLALGIQPQPAQALTLPRIKSARQLKGALVLAQRA